VVGALARAILFFGLWLVLVDSTDEPDLITGAVVAVIAAALAGVLRSLGSVHARPRAAMLRFAYRPLLALVSESVLVTAALARALLLRRPLHGRFRTVRFRPAGEGPEAAARRMLAEWGGSLAPNRYVIGIDAERQVLLVHELVASSSPLDPLELG
jgi:multisubunit Na+/H+ antiporter MnhE subunit